MFLQSLLSVTDLHRPAPTGLAVVTGFVCASSFLTICHNILGDHTLPSVDDFSGELHPGVHVDSDPVVRALRAHIRRLQQMLYT